MTLLTAFNFDITLLRSAEIEAGTDRASDAPAGGGEGARLGDGGFQECTGLEIEMDMQDYMEGGRNDGVIRRVGRARYAPLVLKRGMFAGSGDAINRDLWEWLQGAVSGRRPIARYDGIVRVRSRAPRGDVRATWAFARGLPMKIVGPQLHATTGQVALEELHIAHEGLRLEAN